MKKLLLLFTLLLVLTGCKKFEEMPKLKAKSLSISYGEELPDLTYDNLLDLSDFNQDEIEELELNGEISARNLVIDRYGNLQPGFHEIKVSYYSDVVVAIVEVKSADDLPIFNHVEAIQVPVGEINFDFSQYKFASSPINETLYYVYDTKYINFAVPGQYPLVVTAYDRFDNKKAMNIAVNIIG